MPSSVKLNLKEIKEFLGKFKKDISILDIGAGAGDWSPILKKLGFNNIDALEIWQPYIEQYNLKEKYNKVIHSDVRDIKDFNYDLIMMGDVLEHLTYEDARKVLDTIYKSAKVVLITVPYEFAQTTVYGNKFEIHEQADLNDKVMGERYPELIKLIDNKETTKKTFFNIATWYWQKENINDILETKIEKINENKPLRILHFANYAPRKSGLYECTKDQIKYERKYGIDSQMAVYEYENPCEHWNDDGWMKPVSWDWAENADIFVIHRGLPKEVENKFPKTKQVVVIHGTSDFLILNEILTKANETSFNTHINLVNNCEASVSVNLYDYEILKLYDYYNKLNYIQDSIDFERFNLEGYKYPFLWHPQIIFCDSLRINKNPSHIIWAMKKIHEKIPTAKLTIISLDLETILTWRNMLMRSKGGSLFHLCENVLMEMTEIRQFLRGADILWNGNVSGIFSRVEIEAMACGCSVISWDDTYTKWKPKTHNIEDIANCVVDCWNERKENIENNRQENYEIAFKNFNIETNVKEKFIPLYNKILGK
jgi:glycosyltransferase involved in cell wall biosynthesis